MTDSQTATELVDEFTNVLDGVAEPATVDYLVDRTSVDSREEAKDVLETMVDDGMIKTSPGFRYQLASHVTLDD